MAEASHGCARFILEAARPLLAQAGYAGMSMRQLASQAGLLPGSLYHHVTGKQELLLWVVQDVLERRAAAWQALPRRRHALAEVRSFIGFMLAWQAAHPGEAHILRHEHRHLAPHQQAWLARHIHSAQACLQSVLQRGRRQGVCGDIDVESVALAILALIGAAECRPLAHIERHVQRMALRLLEVPEPRSE